VVFKALSPVLPKNFQYFGLFGITIYFLQGAVAGLLMKKISRSSLYSVITSLFFIFSTTMMQRIYGHTSLAAHFILLLCIYVCVTNNARSGQRETAIWSGLFFLAASLHLYFAPMVFFFMAFYFLREYLESRKLRTPLMMSGISLSVLLLTMFAYGAFYSHADPAGGGLGYYSSNLNTLVNPQGASRFLRDLPLAEEGQYEGFGYVGFGVLLAVLFVVFYALCAQPAYRARLRDASLRNRVIPAAGLVLALTVFAISPKITLNSHVLFQFYIPGIYKLWSIFRSTGRFIWPVMYLIMSAAFYAVYRLLGTKRAALLLCVLLLFQYYDLKDWFTNKGNGFRARAEWHTELSSPAWADLAGSHKHIVFLGEYTKLYSFLDLAVRHNITVNDAYLARKNSAAINDYKQAELKRLQNGEAQEDAIYVFFDEESIQAVGNGVLYFYTLDDVTVGVKRPLN